MRPGNHVDGNGRCYHPYLAGWEKYFDVGAPGEVWEDSADGVWGDSGRILWIYARY